MPSIGKILPRSDALNTETFRAVLLFAIAAAMGIVMGIVVESPSKRLIEAVGGAIFLLVALGLDISFPLGVLIVLLPFPAGMSFATSNEALIVVLVMVYAVKQMIRKEPILRRTPVDLPVLIMVGAMLISILRYRGSQQVLELQLRSFFTAIALFYLVVSGCRSKKQIKLLIACFVISIAGAALVASLQMFFPGRTLIPQFIYVPEELRYDKYVRAAGTFGNYSVFGQYMALSTILVSHLLMRSRSAYSKLVYMGILFAVLATFVSAAMRGALFALAIGFAYMAVVGKGEVKLKHWVVTIAIIGVLLVVSAGALLTYLGTGYLFERLQGFSMERGSSISRMETNQFFFSRSLEYPFFGHGPAVALDLGIGGARTNNPHCQYLYYLYTIGLVGLAGFVWFLAKLYFYSLRAIRRPGIRDTSVRGFLVVFHTMFVVFALHELVDDYMVVRLYHHIIWTTFGILLVLSRMVLKEDSEPPPQVSTTEARFPGRMSER